MEKLVKHRLLWSAHLNPVTSTIQGMLKDLSGKTTRALDLVRRTCSIELLQTEKGLRLGFLVQILLLMLCSGSCCHSLQLVLRRVCCQLADISASMALTVVRSE